MIPAVADMLNVGLADADREPRTIDDDDPVEKLPDPDGASAPSVMTPAPKIPVPHIAVTPS